MQRHRTILWFVLGFVVATLAAALYQPSSARAQVRTLVRVPEPGGAGATRDTSPAATDATSGSAVGDGEAAAINPGEEPIPEDDLGGNGRPLPAGMRPAVRDGDVGVATDPVTSLDGLVGNEEPPALPDGIDQTKFDTRSPEDIAAFENPPAGHDPLLFQIEEADPLRQPDRRIARLARIEPYDPIGIRIGSFVLFPEVDLATAYISNIFRSANPKGDIGIVALPSARLVSNWATHALEFDARGNLSWLQENESENNRGYTLGARGRLDVSRRINVQADLSRDVSQESRSVLEASKAGDRAEVTTDRVALSYNQRFNRLSVQLRGSVAETDYGAVTAAGVTTSNLDRNFREETEAVRATYELKPTLSVFSEVEFDQRQHQAAASDGIKRDSTGERYRAGVSFGQTGQILRGDVSVGYGVQRPDDFRLSNVSGALVDANLAWRMSALTSLLLTARSDMLETNVAGSSGAISRRGGAEVRHAFRNYLIGSAGLTYTITDYTGIPVEERELAMKLGLEYFVNREIALYGRYTHTRFDTTVANGDWNNDEFIVGVKIRR